MRRSIRKILPFFIFTLSTIIVLGTVFVLYKRIKSNKNDSETIQKNENTTVIKKIENVKEMSPEELEEARDTIKESLADENPLEGLPIELSKENPASTEELIEIANGIDEGSIEIDFRDNFDNNVGAAEESLSVTSREEMFENLEKDNINLNDLINN